MKKIIEVIGFLMKVICLLPFILALQLLSWLIQLFDNPGKIIKNYQHKKQPE